MVLRRAIHAVRSSRAANPIIGCELVELSGVLRLGDRGVVARAQALVAVPEQPRLRHQSPRSRRVLRLRAQRAHAPLRVPGPNPGRDVLRRRRAGPGPTGRSLGPGAADTHRGEQSAALRPLRLTSRSGPPLPRHDRAADTDSAQGQPAAPLRTTCRYVDVGRRTKSDPPFGDPRPPSGRRVRGVENSTLSARML